MTWSKLKDKASKYKTIYVTGCQRTGTTFCAKALAEEIGYRHIDEAEFNASDLDKFLSIDKNKSVIQCPALFHLFPNLAEGELIVYIDRSTNQVSKSMVRSGWYKEHGKKEYSIYKKHYTEQTPQSIHELKESHYLSKMRYLENLFVLDFNSLKEAKGYLPLGRRKNFTIKQTA
jgi:hypothetical protein